MLIDRNGISRLRRGDTRYVDGRYEVYWRGFVYVDGVAPGSSSIAKFADALSAGVALAACLLKGVYFVTVLDRLSGARYAFVDASGLFHAFCSEHYVGTSFIEIAALEGFGPKDFDREALVEFFHFGGVYDGKTAFAGVRKIAPAEIVALDVSGRRSMAKALPGIAEPPQQSFGELMSSYAASIAGERVSVDLTGGIDSRLLAVALDHFGLRFELAASGVRGNTDLDVAEQVAAVLGRELHITYHDPQQSDWQELFDICDGSFDLAKADRPLQLQRDRVRRGVTLAISGAGGELFKDFWWLQDFPLYARREARLERLYSMRISPAEPAHELLAQPYRSISREYRARRLASLAQYAVAGNTQTYDRIYYRFKMREFAGRFLTNSTQLLRVHAPYLEFDSVRIGYALPRSMRFFNRFHRQQITKMNPLVARIATTEGGMSVSNELRYVSADLKKYVADRYSRLDRKLRQKSGKPAPQESADHPGLPALMREELFRRRSVERMKDVGFLHGSVGVNDLRAGHLGTVLALDLLCDRLGREKPAERSTAA
jgi:asparagine synthetase B (glutamine-hydrolysing)